MAGIKLSAKAAEEYDFLEAVTRKCEHISSLVEQYASANKGAEIFLSQITRTLGQVRQQAMIKNLGFVADHAGMLGVAAARGSQLQRARTIREGASSLKQLVERTMKAIVDTDRREKGQKAEEKLAAGGGH
jgi:hypothetical protein